MIQTAFGGVQEIAFCEKCGRLLSNPISIQAGMGPICRGHSGATGGSMDKAPIVDWNAWGSRFDHEATYTGSQAHCLIWVRGNVVICTEAPDNHGISITNAAEDIATQVCREHHIPMDQLVWIEHYVHRDDRTGKPEHRFDLVTFDTSTEPHLGKRDGLPHFRHPKWKYQTADEVVALFGRPLPI